MSEQTPEQPSTAPNPALQRQRASQLAQALRTELQKALIGQGAVIDDVLTALLAGGHVLVEGVPGSARPCWYAPWRAASTAASRASSSPPT